MKVTIEKQELVIRIALEEPHPSKSGLTQVVASSYGNVVTDVNINGRPVIVGVNAFIKDPK